MKINVYCQDRGWLFEDLKREIASYGAKPSSRPLRNFDAYICIRTKEAPLSPKPKKTVVQVHDMKGYDLSPYGLALLVHESQNVKGNTTPRVFPFEYEGIFTGNDEKELSQSIIRHIDNYGLYKPTALFKRADWCKAQIDLARGLI